MTQLAPNTPPAVPRAGGLPTTAKNTLTSKATASTVFGRDRAARNSRYASSCGTPSRTTSPPAAVRERCRQGATQVMLGTLSGHEDYPHIKHDRMSRSH